MNASEPSGYLCIFLNAHMPYVAPTSTNAYYLDDWLCASIFESYLPIVEMLDRLADEGVPYHLNLAISPALLEMLASADTKTRMISYIQRRLSACQSELERLADQPELLPIAQFFTERVQRLATAYQTRYHNKIIASINRLANQGYIEILAGTATGAYLPLLEPLVPLALGQIQVGCENYHQYFSNSLQGFWSFSEGYVPELDDMLLNAGINYTIVRSLSVVGATPRPQAATFRPVRTPQGLVVFPTDIEAMLDIFQDRSGFISSPEYLNIITQYRDISKSSGSDEEEQLPIFAYYNRQHRGEQKQRYNPQQAISTAQMQAQTFVDSRIRQVRWVADKLGKPAIITISLKAELFGQGWFEAVEWLEEVLRLSAEESQTLRTSNFKDLASTPDLQVCTPNASSGNRGSFNANWLNESNSWIYKHLHLAGQRMVKMAKLGHQNDDFRLRTINQATRELLLAQCSDWPTMISCGLESKWARKTIRRHLVSFHKLFDDFREGRVDEEGLRKLEERCPIFKQLDYQKCYKAIERSTAKMSTSQQDQATPLLVNKDEVIAGIVQIQKVTKELAVLCQQALSTDKDVSIDISAKACESVSIVEDLAQRANDPSAMQRYLQTTTILENIIKVIADTNDAKELLALHREAIDAVDAWAQTVEDLLKSIISQAN